MSALIRHFYAMAQNNACSNLRLLDACAGLGEEEFLARRTGFFPSLAATLNHILQVDRFYLDGLRGEVANHGILDLDIPYRTVAALQHEQIASDLALIRFCETLADADLARGVRLDRGGASPDVETVASVLPHLFVHQIHHRGQAHAMLSGSPVAPPQLDEFFLLAEQDLRRRDLEAFRQRSAGR